MFNSRTITNGLLTIIAFVLFSLAIEGNQPSTPTALQLPVSMAQEGDLPPTGEVADDSTVLTATAHLPGTSTLEDNAVIGDPSISLTGINLMDRFLTFSFLIMILALGTESVVEIIRYFLREKIILKPGPVDLLKELGAWLPQKTGSGPGTPPPSPPPNPDGFDAYKDALYGIACNFDKRNAYTWRKIFDVLAQEEENYQVEKKKYLRLNRAISFGVAVILAFLTGVNAFHLLLSSTAEDTLNGFWLNIGGLLLSASAASAGASFWHDMFDKLRGSKEIDPPPPPDTV